MRNSVLRWMVALVVALPVGLMFAQTQTQTRTVSETEINASLAERAASVGRTSVRTVDLQPGQIVVTGSIPAGRTIQGTYTTVFVPVVENGDVRFDLVSISINGASASASRLDQIAAAVSERLENALQNRNGDNISIISVVINDTELTITFATDAPPASEEPVQ